jgi:hypothetical protein
MSKKMETKVVDGVKWFRYEGDSFWQTEGKK